MHCFTYLLILITVNVVALEAEKAKCGQVYKKEGGRIVGGRPAEKGETPWIVALFEQEEPNQWQHVCGAAIISEQWLLTAAHCMEKEKNNKDFLKPDELKGIAGTLSITPNDQKSGKELIFDKLIVHEDFKHGNMSESINDIALLHLKENITLSSENNLSALCLPPKDYNFEKLLIVAGWGKEHELGDGSETLKIAPIYRINDTECEKSYKSAFHEKEMFCAGVTRGKRDSCQGDSGGPLTKQVDDKFFAAGIVSFGRGCGRLRFPGVYTRLSHYVDWIEKHTNITSEPIKKKILKDQLIKVEPIKPVVRSNKHRSQYKSLKERRGKYGKFGKYRLRGRINASQQS